MALNLKTFGTRTLSAIVFVILLLGCVSWNYYLFTFFFCFVALVGLIEFYSLQEKSGFAPLKRTGYFFAIVLYLVFINWDYLLPDLKLRGSMVLASLILFPFLFLFISLIRRNTEVAKNAFISYSGLLYVILPMCLLHQLVFDSNSEGQLIYYPNLLLGIIFLIWCNDTFAYIGGSLFGKHKLIERISPGKTWEGTLTGIVLTFALSSIIQKYLDNNENNHWPYLGVFVPVLATCGDLVESTLKRQAQVKDSGKIMPGHGGVLDRFDSLLFVSPFVVVFLKYLNLST